MTNREKYIQAYQRLKNAKTIMCKEVGDLLTIGKELNIPKGKIDLETAVSNLVYWEARGWTVEIK